MYDCSMSFPHMLQKTLNHLMNCLLLHRLLYCRQMKQKHHLTNCQIHCLSQNHYLTNCQNLYCRMCCLIQSRCRMKHRIRNHFLMSCLIQNRRLNQQMYFLRLFHPHHPNRYCRNLMYPHLNLHLCFPPKSHPYRRHHCCYGMNCRHPDWKTHSQRKLQMSLPQSCCIL